MSWMFYNPHPKGKLVNDCVKRAFTLATGKDYMEVQRELNGIKNDIGAKIYSDKRVTHAYIKSYGWTKISFKAIKGQPRMTAKQFVKDYPKGTYVCRMAHHLATIKDGVLYDTWDSSDKCIYCAWKVS